MHVCRTLAAALLIAHGAGGMARADEPLEVSPEERHMYERTDACDKAIFAAKSWADLRRWSEEFGKDCDGGYTADAACGVEADLLGGKWEELPKLAKQIRKNPAFKVFVLRHIDATWTEDELQLVLENAEKRCAHGYAELCVSIATAVREALAELGP